MKERLELLAAQVIRFTARALSRSWAMVWARWLGRLVAVLGYRRTVVRENLKIAFGNSLSADERSVTALKAYENLATNFIEFLRLDSQQAAHYATSTEWCGLHYLDQALERGRGVIAASAHYGNWEVLGAGAVALGYPMSFVVQQMRNRAVDEIVLELRQSAGLRILDRGRDLRRIKSELQQNRIVCIMCDQDARRRGIFLPFFGRPASTHKGPAQLALRWGAAFIPAFGWRKSDGTHRVTFYPEIIPGPGGDEASQVRSMLSQFNALLETTIRADPTQYLWHHKRWKTLPGG